jgi:hypothetical protein
MMVMVIQQAGSSTMDIMGCSVGELLTNRSCHLQSRRQRPSFIVRRGSSPLPRDYFLLTPPRDRSSRLRWRGSSRDPLATAAREREVALDSPTPGLTLWALVGRLPLLLLVENSRLVRLYCCSLGSIDEVGLLLDATALLDALPVREDERGLSAVLSVVLSPERSVLCI